MGFHTHPSTAHRLDLAPAAQLSPGALPLLRIGEKERQMEREARFLADHQAGKEKARMAKEGDAVKWQCTIVIAEAGKIWPKTFLLLDLPQREEQFIAFSLEGYAARLLYAADSIRTMELHPVCGG